MRFGPPKNLKEPPRKRFAAPSKTLARQLLIDTAIASELLIERIFTLPGEDGLCAQQFLSVWEDAHIVGIDRDAHTLDRTELTERGEILFIKKDGTYRHLINSFYQTTIHKMVLNISPQKRHFRNGDVRHLLIPEPFPDFNPFDLAYLDYCGKPTLQNISDVKEFGRMFVNKGGIIGVTFNLTGVKETPEKILLSMENSNLKGIQIERYTTGKTKKLEMCLAILRRI